MKKIDSKKIFCVLTLGIIFFGAASICIRVGTRVLIEKNFCRTRIAKIVFFDREDLQKANYFSDENTDKAVTVNWKKLYPFENETAKAIAPSKEKVRDIKVSLQIDVVSRLHMYASDWFEKNIVFRAFCVTQAVRIENFFSTKVK